MDTDGEQFRPADRLLRSAAIRTVLREGTPRTSGPLRIRARENSTGRSRLGFAIGRVPGGAVARNRIRRVIREGFRRDASLRKAGLDIVVGLRGAWPDPTAAAAGRLLRAALGIPSTPSGSNS